MNFLNNPSYENKNPQLFNLRDVHRLLVTRWNIWLCYDYGRKNRMKTAKIIAGILMFVSVNASSVFGFENRLAIEITHLFCSLLLFFMVIFICDGIQQDNTKDSPPPADPQRSPKQQ
jgi:hypothetical protein